MHASVGTRLAIATVIVLCGITDKCGGIFGPKVGKELKISSAPEGAKVSIDGVEKGVTPLTLTDLDVEENQKQKLTFTLEGYEEASEEVTWTLPEQSVTVALVKAPKERVITVKTIPSNSKVFIDGNKKGETPCSFSMDLVDDTEFNILLQRKGYDDVNTKVTVGTDTILTLTYNFKREGGKSIPEMDEILSEQEKKWRSTCRTYNDDSCSFSYSIDPSGAATNVDNVKCKYKDITNCTKKQVEKMVFPTKGDLVDDSYTWKGSN